MNLDIPVIISKKEFIVIINLKNVTNDEASEDAMICDLFQEV